MANIFSKWTADRKFTDEVGWSCRYGILSYQGIAIGVSYHSKVVGRRVVVTTANKAAMIKLNRRMYRVSDKDFKAACDAAVSKVAHMPACIPPKTWTDTLLRALIPSGLKAELYPFLASEMDNHTHGYIVLTKRETDEMTRFMRKIKSHPWSNIYFFYTSNEDDIVLFRLLSEQGDVIINIGELKYRAREHYCAIF